MEPHDGINASTFYDRQYKDLESAIGDLEDDDRQIDLTIILQALIMKSIWMTSTKTTFNPMFFHQIFLAKSKSLQTTSDDNILLARFQTINSNGQTKRRKIWESEHKWTKHVTDISMESTTGYTNRENAIKRAKSCSIISKVIRRSVLSDTKQKQTICVTPACVSLASGIMDNINMSADPCNDFYEFACGNFMKSKIVPPYVEKETKTDIMDEVILKQLKVIVEETLPLKQQDPYAFLKKLYMACVNDTLSADAETNNVKNIFKGLGGWPTLEGKGWNDKHFDWITLIFHLRKIGIPHEHFYNFYVDVNPLNTSHYTLFLDVKPTPSYGREILLPHRNDDTFLPITFHASRNDIEKDSPLLQKFKDNLLEIQNLNANDSFVTTLLTLHHQYSDLQCLRRINDYNNLADTKIDPHHPITVKSQSALLSLRQLLNATPKRVQANYIFGEIAHWMYHFIPKIRMKYYTIKESECVIHVENNLPLLLNSLYVKKYLTPDIKKEVKQLWSNITNQFENTLSTTNWFDDDTRATAIKKLKSMKTYVGHPDELVVERNIENYYKRLKIDFKSYLNAMMSINLFKCDEKWHRLQQPTDEYTWIEHSAVTTSSRVLYFPSHNNLYLPAGLIVNGAFNEKWPQYINYALAGTLLGHTITHSVDVGGSRFDKNGNAKKWWSQEDVHTFRDKTQCFVHQYQKYKVPISQGLSSQVNGLLTQEENIADNTGLMLAFLAYTNWTKSNEKELTLPGLNFTANQTFWLSYAQQFCFFMQPDQVKRTLNDIYAPNNFRVIGTLSNSKDFSREFNCTEGFPMNPKKKCLVCSEGKSQVRYLIKLENMNCFKGKNSASEENSPTRLTVGSSSAYNKNQVGNAGNSETDNGSFFTKMINGLSQYWNKAKSTIEKHFKVLTIIFLIMFILIIILIIIIVTPRSRDSKLCLTSTCIESSSKSLKYLDTSVDPCTDFYSFACGRYVDELDDLENVKHKSIFSVLSDLTVKQIRFLIQQPLPQKASKAHVAVNRLYSTCKDDTLSSSRQMENIKSILSTLNIWPMMTNAWKDSDFDFTNVTKKLREVGIPYNFFFTLDVGLSLFNTSYHSLGMHLQNVIVPDLSVRSQLTKIVDKSIDVQKEFVDLTLFINKFDEILKEIPVNGIFISNISQIQILTAGFNWLEYVRNVVRVPEVPIGADEIIILTEYERIIKIMNLLRNTPKRTQANYIFVTIFGWMVSSFTKGSDPRDCISIASKSMYLGLNSLYIKKYFDVNTKSEIQELVLNIRDELMGILKTVDWLDDSTRATALDKLISMNMCVGYPDELQNQAIMEEYFKSLDVNFASYLNATMAINLFNTDHSFRRLRNPVTNCYWVDNAKDVTSNDASYLHIRNKILLPAAFLQSILYDTNRPHYMNYAITGSIIGREISHGFDSLGKAFDKNGNARDWWSKQTSEEFEKKTKCFVEQYQQYTIPQLNLSINGVSSLAENIADNGGVKLAYLAYNKWLKFNEPENPLPGFNFTTNQLFWISYAQFWCSYDGKDYLKKAVSGQRPPNRIRVIGSVSNSESFSKDFNCPVDSPMNPSNKWKQLPVRKMAVKPAFQLCNNVSKDIEGFKKFEENHTIYKELCLTPSCIDSASKSLKYLDNSINPCTDFYSFACGNYVDELEDLQNVSSKNAFELLTKTASKNIKQLIHQLPLNNNSKLYVIFNSIYNICQNDVLSSSEQIENAISILKKINKWPLMTANWNPSDFNFVETTRTLKRLGIPFNFFFNIDVPVHPMNRNQCIIAIQLNNITPLQEINITNILPTTTEFHKTDLENVKKFNKVRLEILSKVRGNQPMIYNILSLQTEFDWWDYIRNAIFTTNTKILKTDYIKVYHLEQLIQISNLISRTPKRTLANYIFLTILGWMYPYLTKVEISSSSSSKCFSSVSTLMPRVLSSLYVKTYLDVNTKEQIKQLVLNLRNEFMNSLQTVEWFDEQTRLRAIEKLDALDFYVGYPEELIDDETMESYYKNVQLKVDYTSYLNVVMSVNAFNQDLVYKRLGSFNNTLWAYEFWDVTISNSDYSLSQNKILIPAAFLQRLLFDRNRPHYMNYAILGMILGHEITQGFDQVGRNYDKDGKLKNWWNDQSLVQFKKKAQCIEDQYQRYIIPEINKNVSTN
ncbi:hypothetical protein FQA39_LY11307 [Lamprigera yunnana]|nr:hypothetical protein FQA39_LY11307 [Lamprigera yunnana]